jgi:hypothetical protein
LTAERGKVGSAGQDWERECGAKEGSFQNSVDVLCVWEIPGKKLIMTHTHTHMYMDFNYSGSYTKLMS